MNNINENEIKLLTFWNKYKIVIISILVISFLLIGYIVISTQVQKANNTKAASIYYDWSYAISSQNQDEESKFFNELISQYPKSGYAQIALLNQANANVNLGDIDLALQNLNKLIEITNGINGNKIYNKIAKVSSARLLYSKGEYNKALNMIEEYSAVSTNAYIHELTGDILVKLNKVDLARLQYEKASEKYKDQTSITIVAMKIADLGL
ncbi:MAG: hypothetical protein CMD58_04820 [Gammaproteobacteria bacterium]|nr:hypothetical protein [Gammaproteobacteria bacterium]